MREGSRGYLKTMGIDDGFFPSSFKERRLRTILVGVLCSDKTPIDLKIEVITVDGLDGTQAASSILKELGDSRELGAVFMDGVTVAGFNIIDPDSINQAFNVPVIVIFKHGLNLAKVRQALSKHFEDWEVRYSVIKKVYERSKEVITKWRRVRISCSGINCYEASSLISKLQTISPYPEPLRLSDIIASGLTRRSKLLDLINDFRERSSLKLL